ncbi:hypothetical protein KP509_29G050000 [Ceratopteris richardii]|uniref:Uncharacterized protein n=1 Tax=Ceratopteris richardii TaxID=49495 RepID=A0A8T2R6M8_CERRI|nr:hypothetical protein KP509_29G050000 [Ceratopteris richardii]
MSNVEHLWREFFADPSQWWDRRKRKTNPNAPDFQHKRSRRSLWVNGRDNPGWVKLMLDQQWEEKKKDQSGRIGAIHGILPSGGTEGLTE